MSGWEGSINNPNSERAKARSANEEAIAARKTMLRDKPKANGKHHETPKSSTYDSLAIALELAAKGLPVFPCGANKRPLIKGGTEFSNASTDPDRIREMWQIAGKRAELIGVPTGPASGFDALDLDPRNGSDPWREANLHRLPNTLIHGTPGLPKQLGDPVMPGEHWIFRHVEGVRNLQDGKTIAPGIDVRGQGGYIIYPPSAGYSIANEMELADWPVWLLPLVLKASAPAPRPEPASYATPTEVSDKRHRAFIDREVQRVRDAPIGGRHQARLTASISIGGVAPKAGLSDAEAERILIAARPPEVEEEKERRTIRWGLAEGRKRPIDLPDREQFQKQRRQSGGSSSASPPPPPPQPPSPEPTPEPEPDDPVEAMVKAFNAKFFVLNEHGKAIIYAPRHDPILNRRYYDRMSFEDLEKLYCNRFIQIGTDKDGSPIRRRVAPLWLNHSDRHQYVGGVVFDPSGRTIAPDVLNLWCGFAVKPRKGDWRLMQQHILDVICNYDQALLDYVLDWMADLVQNPAKQGEVALVLRGPEGCGKGILARAIKYLFGQHGLAISNAKHLIGNFNGHLRDAVFLFADEAFYAGDKQHVGVLKALITEPYLTIEGKYQNAVQMPNFLHIMLASNEDWVIPASLDSRRYAVIEVQGSKIGAHDYFGAIQKQLDDGGYAAMLHDLLNRDLSKSNLRAVPVTEALLTQRKMSLDTIHRWWLDCLHRGYVFQSRIGLEDHFGQWHDFLPTEVLFASYERYCSDHRERHPLPRELFGRWMVEAGARSARRRNQAIGEHMVDATMEGRTSRIAELIMHPLPHGYASGDLDAARAAFCSFSGLRIEWGEAEGCSG